MLFVPLHRLQDQFRVHPRKKLSHLSGYRRSIIASNPFQALGEPKNKAVGHLRFGIQEAVGGSERAVGDVPVLRAQGDGKMSLAVCHQFLGDRLRQMDEIPFSGQESLSGL